MICSEMPENWKSKYGVTDIKDVEALDSSIENYRSGHAKARHEQHVAAALEDSDFDSETEIVEDDDDDDMEAKKKLDVRSIYDVIIIIISVLLLC